MSDLLLTLQPQKRNKGCHVRVVRYRSAKPFTPVRIWLAPPKILTISRDLFFLHLIQNNRSGLIPTFRDKRQDSSKRAGEFAFAGPFYHNLILSLSDNLFVFTRYVEPRCAGVTDAGSVDIIPYLRLAFGGICIYAVDSRIVGETAERLQRRSCLSCSAVKQRRVIPAR